MASADCLSLASSASSCWASRPSQKAGQRGAEDCLVLFREFSQHGQPLFALAAFEEKAGRPHARRGARCQVALELLLSFFRVAVPEQDETVGTV